VDVGNGLDETGGPKTTAIQSPHCPDPSESLWRRSCIEGRNIIFKNLKLWLTFERFLFLLIVCLIMLVKNAVTYVGQERNINKCVLLSLHILFARHIKAKFYRH